MDDIGSLIGGVRRETDGTDRVIGTERMTEGSSIVIGGTGRVVGIGRVTEGTGWVAGTDMMIYGTGRGICGTGRVIVGIDSVSGRLK